MAKMTAKKYEMDMCNGPLLKQILIFTMPLMASGILQLLFNAADMVVAGRYAGSTALGAVGATSSLINLIINVFMGLSVGANVVIAHFYGANSKSDVFETVHTAIAMAGVCGVFLLVLGFVYNAMNSFHQTAVSFTGQNMGARKYDRVKRIALQCMICVVATGMILGGGCNIFAKSLLSLYNSEPEVIGFGQRRLIIIMSTYYLCGIMDVIVGVLRGMGYSIMPMIVSLLGACAFRIVWIYTVFAANPTPECLYISYPISWAITFLVHLCCYFTIARKRLKTRELTSASL